MQTCSLLLLVSRSLEQLRLDATECMDQLARSMILQFPIHSLAMRADFEKSMQSFRTHELNNVPYIAYFPPSEEGSPSVAKSLDPKLTLQPGQDMSPRSILNLLAESDPEASNVPVKISPAQYTPLVLVAAAAIAVIGASMAADPDSWTLIRRPQLWMVGSLLVMGVSISGVVYCIIRTPPLYGMDASGKPTAFNARDSQG